MKIAIASDHAGLRLKKYLYDLLKDKQYVCDDFGAMTEKSCDYPHYALSVARAVSENQYDIGILVCGTGIGMSITANKVKGIRAALCHNADTAQFAKAHNNANIICLGSKYVGLSEAKQILNVFLSASFEGGRHERRLSQIQEIENLW